MDRCTAPSAAFTASRIRASNIRTSSIRQGSRPMLGIVAAVLFFVAFLINAAEIGTNDTFSSGNVMLLGLTLLALHVAGIGTSWHSRRRR
jgi:hypothetical protein